MREITVFGCKCACESICEHVIDELMPVCASRFRIEIVMRLAVRKIQCYANICRFMHRLLRFYVITIFLRSLPLRFSFRSSVQCNMQKPPLHTDFFLLIRFPVNGKNQWVDNNQNEKLEKCNVLYFLERI